jgi:hypothetical protein
VRKGVVRQSDRPWAATRGAIASGRHAAAGNQVLHRGPVRACNAPDVKDRLLQTGWSVVGDSPGHLAAFTRAENAKSGAR